MHQKFHFELCSWKRYEENWFQRSIGIGCTMWQNEGKNDKLMWQTMSVCTVSFIWCAWDIIILLESRIVDIFNQESSESNGKLVASFSVRLKGESKNDYHESFSGENSQKMQIAPIILLAVVIFLIKFFIDLWWFTFCSFFRVFFSIQLKCL